MTDFKVLLVDDEEEYLDVLLERLSARNVDVKGATSGDEALILIGDQHFDIVVLDVRMPGRDGVDTLIEIKKTHPEIEVIMLSGHADIETAVKGMDLGAFDYLIKPIRIDELLYRLEDAYKTKSLRKLS